MNATVAWSYQLLDPEEQRAFRRFGALPGLFPIEAAAHVLAGGDCASAESDDALGAVARLIDKSLGTIIPGFVPEPWGGVPSYQPTWVELTVSAGLWALGAFLFTVLAKAAIAIELGRRRLAA